MTYADNYNIRSNNVLWTQVANALDGLLVSSVTVNLAGTINTTSTSAGIMSTCSTSLSVVAGQSVLVLGMANFSHGTINGEVDIQVFRDTTNLGTSSWAVSPRSSTGGGDCINVAYHIDSPTTNTYTYSLKWYVQSGTGYSSMQRLVCMVFRTA